MLQQKRRFIALALIMVLLVGTVSMISTWLLYQTAIEEQKKRLHELVQSQADLAEELGYLSVELNLLRPGDIDQELALSRMAQAHKRFQIESRTGEFTVGKRTASDIRFLILNGQRVSDSSPFATVPLKSPYAAPMKKALFGKSGTLIGIDYKGKEVLAAYTPLFLQHKVLGIVAKIDLDEIKAPFFKANFTIFGIGVVLILIGLALFFKLSEPILQNIQASEKNYRDLVEGANTLILRIDQKGAISFANRFAMEFLPTPAHGLIGVNVRQILGGNSAVQGESSIESVLDFFGGGSGLDEMCLASGSGEPICISWTVRKITDDDGRLVELLCIGNDVSAQHVAREAQRELEERFRGIAKASPVGIIITDIEGNLIYANERMHELSGMTASDLAGYGWLSKVHPDDKQTLQHEWYGTPNIVSDRIEFRLSHKNSGEFWVLGQIVVLNNSEGNMIGYVITLTDISQIKAAEAEQKRLAAAIDQAAEAILITDLDGSITYANPAFEVITGYSCDEVIGKNPRILQSGEQDSAFYNDLWETITSGRVWSGKFVNHKKGGQRYTQEATIGPVRDQKGKTISYVCVARDITSQLSIEAQLRQAQKLESIGELAAGIAHEINTPTQYVSSNTDFMSESFSTLMEMLERCKQLVQAVQSDQPREEVLRLAETVLDEKELKYLAEDIPNALDESKTGLSRISEIVQSVKQLAHPGEVNKGHHNLNEIIANAVTVSSNEWKYVSEIKLDFDDYLPRIYCLKGEVGQVVLNLIINGAHAIEAINQNHADKKGIITIKTFRENGSVVFTVTDTGTGMPQDIMDRIFDPFYTTKEVGKGTGQGLAIAHNVVVNMHGGTIGVESEEGAGTTFIVRMPIDED